MLPHIGTITNNACNTLFCTTQVHVGPMRSTSKGNLRLASRNPEDHILMDPKYLSTQEDIEDFRRSIRLTRELFQMKVQVLFLTCKVLLEIWVNFLAVSMCCAHATDQPEI